MAKKDLFSLREEVKSLTYEQLMTYMQSSEESMKNCLAAYAEAVKEYYDVYWGELMRRGYK